MNPLKYLLLLAYNFAKLIVNKKRPDRILPTTIHIFTHIPLYLTLSIFPIIIGSLNFKVNYTFEIFLILVLAMSLSIRWFAKKKFYTWRIENLYEDLTKKQRKTKNIIFFVIFWISFFLFMYLSIKFYAGYDNRVFNN